MTATAAEMTKKRPGCVSRERRGSVLIETALVMPIFLIFSFLAMMASISAITSLSLQSAAEEIARADYDLMVSSDESDPDLKYRTDRADGFALVSQAALQTSAFPSYAYLCANDDVTPGTFALPANFITRQAFSSAANYVAGIQMPTPYTSAPFIVRYQIRCDPTTKFAMEAVFRLPTVYTAVVITEGLE